MRLYDIDQQVQAVLNAIESGEIPEEAAADTLEAVVMEWKAKAENVALYVKGLWAEILAFKGEEKTLAERRQRAETRAERLAAYLTASILGKGEKGLSTPRCEVYFRASSETVIDDQSKLPERFLVIKPPPAPAPDKNAIKAAVKAGEVVPGAHIEEKKNIQIK